MVTLAFSYSDRSDRRKRQSFLVRASLGPVRAPRQAEIIMENIYDSQGYADYCTHKNYS